jgi:hypothetical protein
MMYASETFHITNVDGSLPYRKEIVLKTIEYGYDVTIIINRYK